ncbi:MAG: hypothetical protein KME04_07120 [Pleurocapsa minor GSE-CHR-MK-17-07R]|jgi:hypothetical protein|nr:hypothetical protein [Pleurocapsa minor GSE-CHR-MK 17-07R]
MAIYSPQQSARARVQYWVPSIAAGAVSWITFLVLGETPLIRASGLALIVVGMALALRHMGAVLSVVGALALAFCPAFWAQTGGAEMLQPLEVIAALAASLVGGVLVVTLSKQRFAALAVGVIVFGGLFLIAVGTPRSLRMTTLLSAWMLYLLIDGLFAANPRPDSPPTGQLGHQHTYGTLLLLAFGVLNDPLFVMFAPALLLALFLSGKRMPLPYWLVLLAAVMWGARGLILLYVDADWWLFSVDMAKSQGLTVPFLLAEGWREPSRWLDMITLVNNQFTPIGLLLGLIGLSRLSRWYPPVGVVLMLAFATFGLFGLLYFGADASVLLLPLLMLLIVWMTYAVYAFSHWIRRAVKDRPAASVLKWLAPAAFLLLPLTLLLRNVTAF